MRQSLAWNAGYTHPQDPLDAHYVPIAKDILNTITGQVTEQFDLSPLPNAKYKNADGLIQHLKWFEEHLQTTEDLLKPAFEAYKNRAAASGKDFLYASTPPEPLWHALDLIEKYKITAQTALQLAGVGLESSTAPAALDILLPTLKNFGVILRTLKDERRQDGKSRSEYSVQDEYDVQDFLAALLRAHFEDLRREEPLPSFGPTRSRCDLYLATPGIFIEIKTTLKKTEKDIIADFKKDIPDYLNCDACKTLIFFIHDPENKIRNQKQFDDLKKISVNGKKTEAIVFSN